ncbi:MAG: DNA polymerase III subunit beta [bacterium]
MKIKAGKSEMLGALNIIKNFISSSTTLQLLSNILFEAEGDTLYLSATDMDISAKIKCPIGKVEKEGKTTIPKKLIQLISEFPEADVIIEVDKTDNIKVQSSGLKAKYNMKGLPAEDFPALQPEDKKLESIVMSQASLKTIIGNIAYAALKDSSKRNLNGVLFSMSGTVLETVATDAHRLAYMKTDLKVSVKTKFEFIVPLKTILEVEKVLETSEDKNITINFYDKLIEFKLEDLDIVSRVIDEKFPGFNQVIPKDTKMKGIVNRDALQSAIKRATAITSDKAKTIVLKFEEDKLYINTSAADEGEAFDEIDIKYTGDPCEVTYNANYILDLLKIVKTEDVEIKLVSATNPGIIKPVGDDSFIYIVMPIRK